MLELVGDPPAEVQGLLDVGVLSFIEGTAENKDGSSSSSPTDEEEDEEVDAPEYDSANPRRSARLISQQGPRRSARLQNKD